MILIHFQVHERLKKADLPSKDCIADFAKRRDFNGKLININKKVTSNKTKHIEGENEINELSKKLNYYRQKGIMICWVEFILQTIMATRIS